MIPTRFKRECITELMKIGPMDETEAAKYFELGYQKAIRHGSKIRIKKDKAGNVFCGV